MAGKGGTQSLDPGAAVPLPGTSLAPGECIDGVYWVERCLGEGGGGAVYLVRHEGLDGARFALKVLHEVVGRSAELLAREGRLAAEVRSAHVVKVAALGRLHSGVPYLVMEYVDGPTLDELLKEGDLSPSETVECGRQLCLALEAVHAQGLIHGDVSLRNLFVTRQPDSRLHLQLGDFGLARRVRGRKGGTASIEISGGRGTPHFMAPEVISGDEIDERSDIFAVGVVLYRLLTGTFPFDGGSTREILGATLRGARPTPGSGALLSFEPVVMRCLASDPAERFPGVREVREALENPVPIRRGFSIWASRRWRRAALLFVAAAATTAAMPFALRAFREHTSIPMGAALFCPDTSGGAIGGDTELAHTLSQAACARIGAGLDLDWGGGPSATTIVTRLDRNPGGTYRIEAQVAGRLVGAQAETPLSAMVEVASLVLARARRPPMNPAEVQDWGATDSKTAEAMRAVWRRRTALVIEDAEREPRALLLRDPALPLAHLLLAEVERDPVLRREAQQAALRYADRLPPARAEALRATLAAVQAPENADEAIERLRRVYSGSPDDLDIGVLYMKALVEASRQETALAVADRMYARFPRRALLVQHYATLLPDRVPDSSAGVVARLIGALPERRVSTSNIGLLLQNDRLPEAEAALVFAHRLGTKVETFAASEALVALAQGDPAHIERATRAHEGTTRSWSQIVGARLRLAGLLLRGQVAAAETFLHTQIAGRRAAGDVPGALRYAAERLRIARLAGGPTLAASELDWMRRALAGAVLPLSTLAFVHTELAIAEAQGQTGAGARAAARDRLMELDAEIVRRAGANALALAAAWLPTLPLVRLALGDAEAVTRWRAASSAWFDNRVVWAYDAGLALFATGDVQEEEAAYRLAMNACSIERHAFESIAARVRLAALLDRTGRREEARALRAHVDRAWSFADHGVRERAVGALQ